MRLDIASFIANCDNALAENPKSVFEMNLELDDPSNAAVGKKTDFMGVSCEIIELTENVARILVSAAELKASLTQCFPDITSAEISQAAEEIKQEIKQEKNKEQKQ